MREDDRSVNTESSVQKVGDKWFRVTTTIQEVAEPAKGSKDIYTWLGGELQKRYRLGPRETEAVSLVLQGLSHREISEQMGISLQSVKNLLGLAYRKAGVNNQGKLCAIALQMALSLPPPP